MPEILLAILVGILALACVGAPLKFAIDDLDDQLIGEARVWFAVTGIMAIVIAYPVTLVCIMPFIG
jgi:hypothetical protein